MGSALARVKSQKEQNREAARWAAPSANPRPVTPTNLRPASDFFDEAEALLEGAEEAGLPVFFTPQFKIRPHEVTIWMGYNGHGKSELLNQVVLDLVEHHGEGACIASLEVRPAMTIKRLARQRSRKERPENGYLPKRTSMDDLTQAECDRIANKLNARPRKRYGYRTPAELYHKTTSVALRS